MMRGNSTANLIKKLELRHVLPIKFKQNETYLELPQKELASYNTLSAGCIKSQKCLDIR